MRGENIDLRIARTLLSEALTRLGRVEGQSGVAGALGALIGRLDEPPSQPSRPPDLWTDVCRAIHGIVAVCLAQGIEREMAYCIRDTFAAAIADDIKNQAERRAKEGGDG